MHPEKSGVFLHLYVNKESIFLNLQTLYSRPIFFKLLLQADTFVEHFHSQVRRDLQLH